MKACATVTAAVLSRRSCRAFTAQPVPAALVRELLELARFAPSGGNLQPWLVHVLCGASLERFRIMMAPKIAAAPLGGPAQYNVYPPNLAEPYRSRRYKVGEEMYALIGINRDNRPGRVGQFARNFDFFGAPLGLFFFLDRAMGPPQWSDVGMLMQNLMLLARERGLESCAQEAWASWHGEVAEFLGVGPQLMLFCGMALGYADDSAPINQLRTERVAVEEFAVFHD